MSYPARAEGLVNMIIIMRVFKLMVFHWSLSDSKSAQVFRTLHSILAILNNVVVWMVSTKAKAPITIGIIVTFMFLNFFNSRARSWYLSFFSLSVLFCGQPEQQSPQFCNFSFLLVIIKSGLLTEIRWSVCISKSYGSLSLLLFLLWLKLISFFFPNWL